jgi:hypothetical protein
MQKIFSTRLDEATLDEMERATRKLGMSKRQFLEEAIQLRVERLGRDEAGDVWSETLGAWQRHEAGATTIRRARRAFRRTFERRHGARDARVHR